MSTELSSLVERRHSLKFKMAPRLIESVYTTNLAINQVTQKNTCQNFPTPKNPEIPKGFRDVLTRNNIDRNQRSLGRP